MSVLSLRGVCLSFLRGERHVVRVLADVSLEVGVGDVVSVLAQRAQGKTTLLRVAAGMVRPDRGRVYVGGDDLWELSDKRRSCLLGEQVVLVGHRAPELDVPMLDSIALPLLDDVGRMAAYARAREALERVGAGECEKQLWESLADWERALVGIARGIVRGPRLLLIDDLTASLGIGETDEVTRLLTVLAKEKELGVLMCVSDAGATAWSARIATLAAGELLEPSRPEPGNIIDFPEGFAEEGR